MPTHTKSQWASTTTWACAPNWPLPSMAPRRMPKMQLSSPSSLPLQHTPRRSRCHSRCHVRLPKHTTVRGSRFAVLSPSTLTNTHHPRVSVQTLVREVELSRSKVRCSNLLVHEIGMARWQRFVVVCTSDDCPAERRVHVARSCWWLCLSKTPPGESHLRPHMAMGP